LSSSVLVPYTGDGTVPLTCGDLSVTATSRPGGLRIVYGDVALPGWNAGPVREVQTTGWRYQQQTAFLVRGASPPVTVSVPSAWRAVMGIAPQGHGVTDSFGIPGCANRQAWNFVLVSFYLRVPGACAPLDVQVGRQTATVWFDLGKRCPGDQ
jgi:hypothetical protein